MKRVGIILAALAAASCSRNGERRAERVEEPQPRAAQTSFVTLEPQAQREAGVAVEPAQVRSIPLVLRSTARLTNDENRTWRVGAITEGRIVTVLVNPGDVVREGQVMARMHSHDIHEARANYRKAASELARAQAAQSFAGRARDRARRLFEIKAASLEQVENAEAELRNAETAVASAKAEMERTRSHLVDFLGIPADFTAPGHRDEDDLIPVRAPAAGVILARNVTPGTVVTPANDVFIVSNLSRLWAIAEVGEEHLSRLRPGMPVKIYVQAYGQEPFSGRIGKLGETLDPATRTVRVRVDVPNPRGRLKPEMYATTEIELGGSTSGVFVPREATQEVRGQTVVFVESAPGRFEPRPVETGQEVNGSVEIARGLKPGERVAVRGTFILKSEFLKASLAEE